MADKISVNDILDPKIKRELQAIADNTKKVIDQFKALQGISKTVEAELKKGASTQAQVAAAKKTTADNSKKLSDVEKEIVKIEQQHYNVLTKMVAERSNENIVLERTKQKRAEQNKEIKQSIALEKTETNSIARLTAENKKLINERNKLNTSTKTGQQRIKEINSQIDKNNKVIKDNTSALEQQKNNVGNYKSALDGMPGSLGRASQGVGRLGQSFKALLANPVVLVIAAIVGAITALYKSMRRSEEGANRLDKVMAGLRAAFAVVADIVTKLAINIFDAFSNPKQAIIDLWEAIKTNIVNRFQGLIELFVGLKDIGVNTFKLIGASVKNIFSDNQKEVDKYKENIAKATGEIADASVKMFTGTDADSIKQFFKDVTNEIKEETKAATELEARRQKLVKLEREFIVERERLNAQIEQARESARNENLSIEERQKLIKDAISAMENLYATEIKFANERAEIVAAEVALGESTTEQLNEAEELRAEAFRKEQERAKRRKRFYEDEMSLVNEAEKEKQTAKKIALETELLNEKRKLANFKGTQEEQAEAFKNYSVRVLEIQIQLAKDEIELSETTAEQKLSIESNLIDKQIELQKLLSEKTKEETKKQIWYETSKWQNITNLANETFNVISGFYDVQLNKIEQQQAQELQMAGDNENAKRRIEERYTQKIAEIKRKQAISDKAAGLFNIGINTAVAITKALPNIPLSIIIAALGAAQAGIVLAQPIPKFYKGVENFTGGFATVGEQGAELIETPHGVMLSPDRATTMMLPKGTNVYTKDETKAIIQNSNIDVSEMVKEQKLTRKALANKTEHHTDITDKGMKYMIRKNNQRTVFIDKYIRS